jgi:hypothetical protein
VLVEWGVGRAGLAPDETSAAGTAPVPSVVVVRRVLTGVGIGVLAACIVFGTLWASRSVIVESVPSFELSLLGIGLVSAGLQAWRDEMLIHGMPLLALERTRVLPFEKVLACGCTSAAAAVARPGVTGSSVAVAAELGIVLGALWVWDWDRPERTRLAAPAAHSAFRWLVESVFSGGLFYARIAANSWAGGDAGMLGGTAAVVALAPGCILALGWAARARMSAGAGAAGVVRPRISPRSS